jgi:hypothetical protein
VVKCHFLNIEVKSANELIVQGVKCIFQKKKKNIFINSITGNKTKMSELRTTFSDNYVAYQHA